MYGLDMLIAIFLFVILCFVGTIIWIDVKKRVPVKRQLHKGTLSKKHYRNYITKVM